MGIGMRGKLAYCALAIAACAWVVVRVTAVPIGVCGSDGRTIEDLEVMEIAVQHQSNMSLRGASSAAQYLATYPECCSVRRKPELTLGKKIFGEGKNAFPGAFSVEIVVQKSRPSEQRFVTALISMNGCGEIIESNEIDRRSLEVE